MTEQSIRILLALYTSIEDNYDALEFSIKYLDGNFLKDRIIPAEQENNVKDAIIESLWFQILLKTSSFLDEWDKFLGVRTNESDRQKLLIIKKVVAPARRQIKKWKDLGDFRDEVIAHNLRTSNNECSLDYFHDYNCPKTEFELYYLVAYLQRMMNVVYKNFPTETNNIFEKFGRSHSKLNPDSEINDAQSLVNALKEVDNNIAGNIWSLAAYEIIKANTDQLDNGIL